MAEAEETDSDYSSSVVIEKVIKVLVIQIQMLEIY